MRTILAILTLVLATGTSMAQQSPGMPWTGSQLAIHSSEPPITLLNVEHRRPIPVFRARLDFNYIVPTNTPQEMAIQLRSSLATYSARTGFEACARMCRTNAGKIVVVPVTIHSHVACVAPERTCPEGSTPLPETIHSHPDQSAFVANEIDAVGWEDPDIEGVAMFAGDPDTASDQDRKQAPLWFVGRQGKLFYLAEETAEPQEVELP